VAHESIGGGGEFVYPMDLTPRQRQALHDRLAVLTQDQAQQVLDELSGRMAIAQVKNPVRYCATLIEGVQRGKFLPELGLKVADARHAEVERRAARAESALASATESRPPQRDLPVKLREAIHRLRTKSRAQSNNED